MFYFEIAKSWNVLYICHVEVFTFHVFYIPSARYGNLHNAYKLLNEISVVYYEKYTRCILHQLLNYVNIYHMEVFTFNFCLVSMQSLLRCKR
jgi:hypothetical protein